MSDRERLWHTVSQNFPKQTGLHLAAYFELENAARLLYSSNGPDLEDSYDRTPQIGHTSQSNSNEMNFTSKNLNENFTWALPSNSTAGQFQHHAERAARCRGLVLLKIVCHVAVAF
jgi:hypothetical protein